MTFKVKFSSRKGEESKRFEDKCRSTKGVTWVKRFWNTDGIIIVKVDGDLTDEQKKELLGKYVEAKD